MNLWVLIGISVGMLARFCGTLMTQMAANFDIVPVWAAFP